MELNLNSLLTVLALIYLRLSPKWKVKLSLVYKQGFLLQVSQKQSEESIFISRINRIWKFKQGIQYRLDEIHDKYLLNIIKTQSVSECLDIGSNIGEFSLCARRLFPEASLVLVEPEEKEVAAARLNLPGSRVVKIALDQFDREVDFVNKNQTGDSHIMFWGESVNNAVRLKTTSLDNLGDQLGLSEFDLIKIEVEGWEPEVLIGGERVIRNSRFVVIDGSAERIEGGSVRETLSMCSAIMSDYGFELLQSRGYVGLFRNRMR